MLSYSDEVITAHLQERRCHLLAEAAAYRLMRGQRRPGHAQLSPLDRWLAAVGTRLVAWGERLQANARRRQMEMQEIARA